MTTKKQRKNTIAIKKMYELPHPGDAYVYDLETENHHFAVGPGALIVHNTDSLFVEFNPRNAETGDRLKGREARQATIDLTAEAGHLVTQALKAPHDFEFDKIFDPMLMFSKKRYAGLMFENNADDYVHKYMGIALKRRDNAPIVKYVYGGAIERLLDPTRSEADEVSKTKAGVHDATVFVQGACRDLLAGKFPMTKLTITKSLRADYKDPKRIAHKVLADRIGVRDPGNKPSTSDRIPFVYIASKGKPPALQGDRIETPSYIKEKALTPDYAFYITNQIAKPVAQLFGLAVDHMPGVKTLDLAACGRAKDPVAAREALAEKILFETLLLEAQRDPAAMEKKGQRSIATLFAKK
jgi:DNA polymerase elongation subunit (family B)